MLDRARRTLDFTRPIAVMLISVMHLIADADDPYSIVRELVNAMAPGSSLALSQVAADIQREQVAEARRQYHLLGRETLSYRTHAEVSRFFDGLDLVPPGVVAVQDWRPDSATESAARSAMWGGIARKP